MFVDFLNLKTLEIEETTSKNWLKSLFLIYIEKVFKASTGRCGKFAKNSQISSKTPNFRLTITQISLKTPFSLSKI